MEKKRFLFCKATARNAAKRDKKGVGRSIFERQSAKKDAELEYSGKESLLILANLDNLKIPKKKQAKFTKYGEAAAQWKDESLPKSGPRAEQTLQFVKDQISLGYGDLITEEEDRFIFKTQDGVKQYLAILQKEKKFLSNIEGYQAKVQHKYQTIPTTVPVTTEMKPNEHLGFSEFEVDKSHHDYIMPKENYLKIMLKKHPKLQQLFYKIGKDHGNHNKNDNNTNTDDTNK